MYPLREQYPPPHPPPTTTINDNNNNKSTRRAQTSAKATDPTKFTLLEIWHYLLTYCTEMVKNSIKNSWI